MVASLASIDNSREHVTPQGRIKGVLAANNPGEPGNPGSWPGWVQLMPHILAIDPAASSDPAVRSLACDATWYLLMHGDMRGGHQLARHLYQEWTRQLVTPRMTIGPTRPVPSRIELQSAGRLGARCGESDSRCDGRTGTGNRL